jgi:hypothetical protein
MTRDSKREPRLSKPKPAATETAPAPVRSVEPLETLIQSNALETLLAAAADARMNEDLALTFLTRRDLPERVLDLLSKNPTAMKHRRVINALVRHPRTPRHVSLPVARRLYTFELMGLALTPTLAADLKMVAEEAIIGRIESISAGERMTLARRASTQVAAALLLDAEQRITEAALDNPMLTEAWVVKALMRDDTPVHLAQLVCGHTKWSVRHEVRLTLLRNPHTPLARAIAIADSLPVGSVKEVLALSRLPQNVRTYLEQQLERRKTRPIGGPASPPAGGSPGL